MFLVPGYHINKLKSSFKCDLPVSTSNTHVPVVSSNTLPFLIRLVMYADFVIDDMYFNIFFSKEKLFMKQF